MLRITKFSDYVIWTDYGLKATTPVKDDDRNADLRKFSSGFVCASGVWIRFCNLSELILAPLCFGFLFPSWAQCLARLGCNNVATFAAWVEEQLSVPAASRNPQKLQFPRFTYSGVVGTFYLCSGRTWNKYI